MATRVSFGAPETRKLQLVGGSTLTLSVPKEWADNVGVQAGDKVLIEQLPGGALRLAPADRSEDEVVTRQTLDASHLTPRQVEQRVLALYLSGRDFIEITAAHAIPASVLTLLETLPRRINGLEIVEQGPDRVVLHDMVDPRQFDPLRAFDHHYGLASRLHRGMLAAIAQNDPARCQEMLLLKQDIDRLGWMVTKQHRLLIRRAYDGHPSPIPPSHALLFGSANDLVLRLGRHGAQLAAAAPAILATSIDDQTRSGLVEVGTRALQICDEAARALHYADLLAADGAHAKLAPFETRLRELQESAARSAMTLRGCGPCMTSNRLLEWLHANALVGAQFADLAVQRACDP